MTRFYLMLRYFFTFSNCKMPRCVHASDIFSVLFSLWEKVADCWIYTLHVLGKKERKEEWRMKGNQSVSGLIKGFFCLLFMDVYFVRFGTFVCLGTWSLLFFHFSKVRIWYIHTINLNEFYLPIVENCSVINEYLYIVCKITNLK